jgi:hypothetical protein
MANSIEPAEQKASQFVSNSSRYLNSEVVYWSDKRILTFKTYKRSPVTKTSNDKFLIINAGLQYRPDRIAQKAYGKQLIGYWWKIMEANNITDVFDLKIGTVLRVPSIV